MRKIATFVFTPLLALSSVGLVGCSSHPKTAWVYTKSPHQSAERQHQVRLIHAFGARVFVQGESVRIVMQSRDLFQRHSDKLTTNGVGVLDHVARLIKTYAVEKVTVRAYDASPAWKGHVQSPTQRLTQHQAHVVASRLWSSGINMRMITSQGMGHQQPVAWNGSPRGRQDNRRVEITFRFYPHKVTYY